MAKRKLPSSGQFTPYQFTTKRIKNHKTSGPPPTKLLDDSDSDNDSSHEPDSVEPKLKVNQEFAKKFEHNKKREELQRLEEKYSKPEKPCKGQYGDKYDEDSESSNDEEEDDAGFLATEALDDEINATLQAIRSKDPAVYDENFTFYKPVENSQSEGGGIDIPSKQKPMYLRDYHRENLLRGNVDLDSQESSSLQTFVQRQDNLQRSVIKEMHAAVDDASEANDDGDFLIPKNKLETDHDKKSEPSLKVKSNPLPDITTAARDPETFLSNFLAARAWIPNDQARFQPFESDDDEEDERAELFETAYNHRFEDPSGSNEVLKSYARDIVAAKSVRRDENSNRKKHRDAQREKVESEKNKQEQERARLKRLKVEIMEERVKMIKKAAGIRGKKLCEDEIFKFLDESWDNDKWTSEMDKYFDNEYYADQDIETGGESTSEDGDHRQKKKIRKPKWNEDIDIKDIVPEFEEGATHQIKPGLLDSDEETGQKEKSSLVKSRKERLKVKNSEKKALLNERKRIEELVDNHLDTTLAEDSKKPNRFHYRETSPTSFGLTAQDILMAPDSSLNQFVGLKKMAPFRDENKKRKDKKILGKKSRLRQWRRETFGNENGPETIINSDILNSKDLKNSGDMEEVRKKKSRSRKKQKSSNLVI